jgi:N-acetylglucosamine-6-phosphate deacetylase
MTNFFDIQVNGYGGTDFNQDDLTADGLHTACERMKRDGAGAFLATIITENVDQMCRRLSNLVALRAKDELVQEMIVGIHIEGPFINETPGYKGAHPVDAIHPANADEMKRMLDAAGGLTKLVTLAPERDEQFRVTKLLAKQCIVVSGGHSNASEDDLKAGVDAGMTMWTHLGNGCPMQMHRHDNIIQRVLANEGVKWCCFIADGAHVPFFALKNYLKAAGLDRCIVTTDCIAPAGLGPGKYTLGRWELVIGEDKVARAPDGSHLVGSALSMPEAQKNLIEKVGLSPEDAQRLISDHPRLAFGL